MKKILLLLIALQSSVLAEINTNNYNWSDKNDNSKTLQIIYKILIYFNR
jgi:hypothetical protein